MKTTFSRALVRVKSLFSSPRSARSATRCRFRHISARRAFLEPLESRNLLATFYVDNSPGLGTGASGDEVFTPVGGTQTTQGGLTLGTNLFLTIGEAVTAAAANAETDIINVADGTYNESVNLAEPMLTVRGNQFGVDAQTARGAETIVDNTSTPFQLSADDVVLDGFTIQGATNPSLNFGVTLLAGTAGSEVRNNIIQNNIAGISLANDSATNQTIISGNLIRNNNNSGPVGGTGIYTDQINAGGALTNVLIQNNTFTGNLGPAVNLGSGAAGSQSNITISSNIMTGNGNGVVLFNTVNSTITRNEITGSAGTQIFIGGGVDGLTITENFIENGGTRGIRVDNVGFAPNANIVINRNSIENNALAGLQVDAGDYVGILNAEFNWWGSPTGPTNPNNPGGTGEEIVDPSNQVDFIPFLTNGNDTRPAIRGFQPGIAELSITKDDTPGTVTAGTPLTYTIVVTNNGPAGTEIDATVIDVFPAELDDVTFTSVSTGGASGNDATGSGNINDTVILPAGSSITYTVTGTVDASTTASSISNTAMVTAPPGTFEITPGNESDTEQTDVVTSADVSVTKTDSPATVTPGQNITYTIIVTNNGPSDAQNVTLSDVIPAGTTFVSFTAPAGFSTSTPAVGSSGGTVTAIDPTLPAGSGPQTFTLVVRANPSLVGGTITNTANVSTTTTDPDPSDNSATEPTTVGTASADVSVTKSDDPETVEAGEELTYTIIVTNNGPSDAQNVVLTDVIPANTTFVSFDEPAGWSSTTPDEGDTGTVTSTRGTLAAGSGPQVFTLVVRANSDLLEGETISNTVTVTSTTADPDLADNADDTDTDVVRPGLPECDIETLNPEGDEGSATLEDDADFPGQGVLIVTGTSGNDVIIIEPNPRDRSEVRVRRNGRTIDEFESSDFDRIVVFGLDGNDKIIINSRLSQDAVLFGDDGNDQLFGARGDDQLDGGEGNDKLFGGSGDDELCGEDGNDHLFGQSGDDTLHGEEGNDKLFGESGDDLLIGGDDNDNLHGGSGDDRAFGEDGNDNVFGDSGDDIVVGGEGNDKVFGGSGEDLVIGGTGSDFLSGDSSDDLLVADSTSHDNDQLALMAILAEWTSRNSYDERIANISGEEFEGENGPFFLNDTTVFDDGDDDTLFGKSGRDWFIIGEDDRVRDRSRNEEVTEIEEI